MSYSTATLIQKDPPSPDRRVRNLGLTGQAATDLAVLKADIEATYVSAYL